MALAPALPLAEVVRDAIDGSASITGCQRSRRLVHATKKHLHSVCVSMRILADFNGKTEIVDVEPFDSMYSLKLKVLSAMFNLQAHEKDRFVQSAMLHSNGADLDAETLEPTISTRGASFVTGAVSSAF